MVELRVNIGDPKTKRTFNKTVGAEVLKKLAGKKVGETFRGELIDLAGYEFEITGGSDASGFPMRKGIHAQNRTKILSEKGIGFRSLDYKKKNNKLFRIKKPGVRMKINVRGEVVGDDISQINCKIVKAGAEDLEKVFGPVKPKEQKQA